MKIDGQVFIVTGGASGLGAATVRLLATQGARVIVADVNDIQGNALASELGPSVRFVHTDVSDAASAQHAVHAAVEAFDGLQGLVNCAGIVHGEKVVGRDAPHALDTFARAIAINLTGSFNLTRLAAAVMAEGLPDAQGERGVIVYTASIAAFDGQIGQAAYAASKAGIVGMTLPIARELARFGIRVMTIAPGLFRTPMMASLTPELQQALGKSVPFPSRLGEPEEFASLVREIVTNPMLNGEVIRLDGAVRLAPR